MWSSNDNISNCDHWVSLDISDQYLCTSRNHFRLTKNLIYSNTNDNPVPSCFLPSVVLEDQSPSQKVCLCVTHNGAGLWVGPTEDASSSSHLGSGGIALARCVFFFFVSAGVLSASESRLVQSLIFPRLFQSHPLSPSLSLSLSVSPSPLPPSLSAMQIVSFANVEKTSGGGGGGFGVRDEPTAEEGAHPPTRATSAPHPHPLVILPQLI